MAVCWMEPVKWRGASGGVMWRMKSPSKAASTGWAGKSASRSGCPSANKGTEMAVPELVDGIGVLVLSTGLPMREQQGGVVPGDRAEPIHIANGDSGVGASGGQGRCPVPSTTACDLDTAAFANAAAATAQHDPTTPPTPSR